MIATNQRAAETLRKFPDFLAIHCTLPKVGLRIPSFDQKIRSVQARHGPPTGQNCEPRRSIFPNAY
jgi:hypothetical protein